MGFKNDQWYGLGGAGEEGTLYTKNYNSAGYYLTGDTTNDPFVYPDRVVRGLGGSEADNIQSSTVLKRGYIRNVLGDAFNAPPIRCQFQFNPPTISQSINQSSGVLNFLNQPLEQFAQPLIGNTSLSFQILFDRSMELNSNDPGPSDPERLSNDPWSRYSPYKVGVLHDLSRLYAVIGVGLNENMMDIYLKQADAQYNNLDETEQAESLSAEDAGSEFASRIEMNLGNSAFLMPLPVRVVFSSMYVVEGFIDAVSVDFTKFTSSMIPMQAAASLSMKVMYAGFARKETFFTESLKALAEASRTPASSILENTDGDVTELEDELVAARDELKSVTLSLFPSTNATNRTSSDSTLLRNTVDVSTGANTPSYYDDDFTLRLFYTSAKSTDNSALYTAIKNGLSVSIESAHIRIWRILPTAQSISSILNASRPGSTLPTVVPGIEDFTYSFKDLRANYAKLADYLTSIKTSSSATDPTYIDTNYLVTTKKQGDGSIVTGKAEPAFLLRSAILDSSTAGTGGGQGDAIMTMSQGSDYEAMISSKSRAYSERQKGNDSRVLLDGENDFDTYTTQLVSPGSFTASLSGTKPVALFVHYYVRIAIEKDGTRVFASAHDFDYIDEDNFLTAIVKKELLLDGSMAGTPWPDPVARPFSDVTGPLTDENTYDTITPRVSNGQIAYI